ncbi:hypothetical protein J3B01_000660 [Coemansia erecta]|nr:hypothetical protein J3B01_000660 [Coemansia erecta]
MKQKGGKGYADKSKPAGPRVVNDKSNAKANDKPKSAGPHVVNNKLKPAGPRSTVRGPPVPVLVSILIGFISTSIMASSLIRLGPQYLEPIYGNVLPNLGFFHGVVISLVLGGILGSIYWQRILAAHEAGGPLTMDTKTGRAIAAAFDIVASLTALAPLRATYMFKWSDALGPMWGPLLTQCTLTFPVFVAGGFVVTLGASRVSYNPQAPGRQAATTAACLGAVAICIWVGQQTAPAHSSCRGVLVNATYAALSGVMIKLLTGHQENVDAAVALEKNPAEHVDNAPEKQLVQLRERQLRKLRFVPTVAFVFCALTTLLTDSACSSGLVARGNVDEFKMVYRNESVTGWVSVTDDTKRNLRMMRSGHSLIGGRWTSTGDSIFGVFYYADAVRMIKGRESNPASNRRMVEDQPEGWTQPLTRRSMRGSGSERALQIGLGVGVSARSLHSMNVRVDVVEIDAAVYEAAIEHFKLPKRLNAVYLTDGRQFIDEAASSTYDYIVHDVFTGGSVPASLFSQSAVQQLQRILKHDGVLAMNYVGIPNDKRTMGHVARTIGTSFAYVRCFAEILEDRDTMTNMMFFASAKPLEFDISDDLLHIIGKHTIRGRVLGGMLSNEVDVSGFVKNTDLSPITDSWNPLPQWQVSTAIQHWHAMRGMVSTSYWLNY